MGVTLINTCINEYKNTKMSSTVLKPLLLVIIKSYGRARNNNQKSKRLPSCALRKFHVTDGQNTCDQIMSNGRSKRA